MGLKSEILEQPTVLSRLLATQTDNVREIARARDVGDETPHGRDLADGQHEGRSIGQQRSEPLDLGGVGSGGCLTLHAHRPIGRRAEGQEENGRQHQPARGDHRLAAQQKTTTPARPALLF